ncbi:GDSL-type esterase/lipase family protein [Akkermansiaceae bacterium]|nr:GDSL-type esterase/lipase family protein [Akkermansiaceae bacterium]MDA7888017.1 GDSL-type esterase/lipase family protein [Akkermansiaceae bacterium]
MRFISIALLTFSAIASNAEPGSSTTPKEQNGWQQRRSEKSAAIKSHQYDLLMIGDSITHNFDKPKYQQVWKTFFEPRNAISLGYSGGRTENTLWNLTHGELEGQSPKVVTLLIGTNNTDDANYPIVHTAEEVAAGTEAIIALLREKLPETKILLLRIFPRTNEYRDNEGNERGSAKKRFAANHRAGELIAGLADNKQVFYLDVNHAFLRTDGSLDPELMPDLLHPSPKGAQAWAEAMEPTLAKLFGDEPRVSPPTNTALIPLPKIEEDFYDWWQRHEAILKIKNEIDPEIVLIGDSITHLWGGKPEWKGRAAGGPESFAKTFAGKRVLNMGYGYDRIQNVLWRLDHGELRGLSPKHVILNIGTNKLWPSKKAKGNTAEEIAEGVEAVIRRIRAKVPHAEITLMGIFPRGEKPTDRSREKITRVNKLLKEIKGVKFLNLQDQFLQADGTISRETMPDLLHPGEAGYEIWGKALSPIIKR